MDREPEGYSSWFNIPQVLQFWEQQEIGPKAGGTHMEDWQKWSWEMSPTSESWALVSKDMCS